MKWAAANTRLSFDTETLTSLRADLLSPLTPSALEQRDKDGSAGEVGRGTRISGVARAPRLAVERGYVRASGGTPHPAGVEHRAGALRHGGGGLPPELAGDVRVGRRREQREKRLDRGVAPREPVGARPGKGRGADRERRPEPGCVLAGDCIALLGERRGVAERHRGCACDVLLGGMTQPARRRQPDGRVGLARVGHGRCGERGREAGDERSIIGLECRPGERGEEEHEAEIGVGGRPPRGCFHGGADGLAEWALGRAGQGGPDRRLGETDRKSTRLNSSHSQISYAVFCLKKKKNKEKTNQ